MSEASDEATSGPSQESAATSGAADGSGAAEGAASADEKQDDLAPSTDADGTAETPPPGAQPSHEAALDALLSTPLVTVTEEAAAVPTISFGFNLGKVPGKGEDSDPIVRDGRELGLVAVFDGMGGAGGTEYETPDGVHTGAYIGSRIARDVVERRMLELLDPEWNLDGPRAAEELRRAVQDALITALNELKAPRSGLRSRLLRALPTTMALVALQRRERAGDVWACHVLWSGDSRAYVFEPATGAHQLSTDDIRDRGDAMANLREDSVVSNAMSADTDFVVHHRMVELTAPFIVVTVTDGCFGYVRSPMHFERMVLATLRDSPSTTAWSESLQSEITATSGDDAAMAVLGVGADHSGFRELFTVRTETLDAHWVEPMDALADEVARAERELDDARRRQTAEIATLWEMYKAEYERYLHAAPDSAEVTR